MKRKCSFFYILLAVFLSAVFMACDDGLIIDDPDSELTYTDADTDTDSSATDDGSDTLITIHDINGVAVPVFGQTPVTSVTETDEYTGRVSWSDSPAAFEAETVYTSTITLTAKDAYTFTGLTADFFTVSGASSVSNAADSGIITAVFPQTAADHSDSLTQDNIAGISTTSSSIAITLADLQDEELYRIVFKITDGNSSSSGNFAPGAGTFTFDSLESETIYTVSMSGLYDDKTSSDAVINYIRTSASGSSDSYTLVSTAQELQNMNNSLSGAFMLMNDIDLDAVSWTPLGNYGNDGSSKFSGKLNGNNRTISNLEISSSDDYQGLFGSLSGDVYMLGLTDADVEGGENTGAIAGDLSGKISSCYASGTVSGVYNTGGLAGYNSGTITNSYSTATVTGSSYRSGGLVGYNSNGNIEYSYSDSSITGTGYCGGIAGLNYDGVIEYCRSAGSVTGKGYYYIGGLAGLNNSGGEISSCYSECTVKGSLTQVGGLVGLNLNSSIVTNCYAAGTVTGNGSVGGLVGNNSNSTVSYSYASGAVSGSSDTGGVAGLNSGTVTDCFYDSETTGMTDTGKGTAKTSYEMTSRSTFTKTTDSEGAERDDLETAWDFAGDPDDDTGTGDIWDIDSSVNGGYPFLSVFADLF